MAAYTYTASGGIGSSGGIVNYPVHSGLLSTYGGLIDIKIDYAVSSTGANQVSFSGSVGCTNFVSAAVAAISKGILRRRYIHFVEDDFSDVPDIPPEKMTQKQFERWREKNGAIRY